MTSYALLSRAAGAGKTTVAVALAQNLLKQGKGVSLARSGDDDHAAPDRALFSKLSSADGEFEVSEAAGGEASAGSDPVIVVVDAGKDVGEVVQFCRGVGGKLSGVVLNRVPERRREAIAKELEAAGLRVLVSIPEDRLLASPTLSGVAAALKAQPMYFDSNGDRPLDKLAIAPISADPGQGYFSRTEAKAVIVRSDKPDLQLAALNAGASCLIVTGTFPFLGYVLERAEADEIPLIPTPMETIETVKVIEPKTTRSRTSAAQ